MKIRNMAIFATLKFLLDKGLSQNFIDEYIEKCNLEERFWLKSSEAYHTIADIYPRMEVFMSSYTTCHKKKWSLQKKKINQKVSEIRKQNKSKTKKSIKRSQSDSSDLVSGEQFKDCANQAPNHCVNCYQDGHLPRSCSKSHETFGVRLKSTTEEEQEQLSIFTDPKVVRPTENMIAQGKKRFQPSNVLEHEAVHSKKIRVKSEFEMTAQNNINSGISEKNHDMNSSPSGGKEVPAQINESEGGSGPWPALYPQKEGAGLLMNSTVDKIARSSNAPQFGQVFSTNGTRREPNLWSKELNVEGDMF